ncbi:MAG: presenilin family intramembrane aspartyl protease PSH [Thermoplasmata archaeon]
MNRSYIPYIMMILSYISTILAGIFYFILFVPTNGQKTQQNNNSFIVIYYLIIIFAFTALIYFLFKKKKGNYVKIFYYIVTFYILFFGISTIISLAFFFVSINLNLLISIILGLLLSFLAVHRIWNRDWFVLDLSGIVISSFSAAIVAIYLGLIPIVILSIILIFYDFISVNITKHMVTLAQESTKNNIPSLFIFPENENFVIGEGERNGILLGLGDSTIPTMIILATFYQLGIYGLILTSIFTMFGLLLLIFFSTKKRPLPGLPFLNTFALIGLLLSFLIKF